MRRKLFGLTILALVAVAVLGCAGAAPPALAPADTAAGYAKPDVLVDTAWMQDHLDDTSVRIIDVSAADSYQEGHLPGAVFLDRREDLTSESDGVRGQIASAEKVSAALSRLGVQRDDTVVLYDDSSNLSAARAYWVLKYYQHDDVRVYNGGTKKWIADGESLTTNAPDTRPSNYVAGEPDPAIRTTGEYVLAHLDDENTVVCDTRGPKEYTGVDARSARGGHIPGAINVDWVNSVNQDGTFKDAATLETLYQNAGFERGKQVITYCQTGVRGAHTWFVLRELLGYDDVRNYDGSWEEWGNTAEFPVEG